MRFLLQSGIILLSFLFVFVWQQTILSQYTIQVVALLIGVTLLLSFKKKGFNPKNTLEKDSPWNIFLINTIIVMLILSTGAVNSPLFFLLYFLAFGVAFVFEPTTVFVFLIGLIGVFFGDIIKNDIMGNILKMGSVVLISPLAFFFGKEFTAEEKQEKQIEKLENKLEQAVEEVKELKNELKEQA